MLVGQQSYRKHAKIKRTKYYERKMWSNTVQYSTAAGLYCTAHDVKFPFCVLELSIRKITNHSFYVNKNKSELGIGY